MSGDVLRRTLDGTHKEFHSCISIAEQVISYVKISIHIKIGIYIWFGQTSSAM